MAEIDYAKLTEQHPERSRWAPVWRNFRAIYRGGEEFRRAAGELATYTLSNNASGTAATSVAQWFAPGRRRRFLFQMEGEPDAAYNARWERCEYVNYVAAICDFHRHWLFSHDPVIRPADGKDPADWFDGFSRNCDGAGKNLIDFIKDVFADVLVCRYAGWLVSSGAEDMAGLTQADAERLGLSNPVLTPYAAEEIINWDRDASGDLRWVLLRKERQAQDWPEPRRRIETFTYVDRGSWATWEAIHGAEDGTASVTQVGGGEHGLGRVPFVWLEVPPGLWPLDKLASWQVGLFNRLNMMFHGMLVSSYPQPFLKTNDESRALFMGETTLLRLKVGVGPNPGEEFGWVTANTDPLRFVAEQLKEQRDEGYRIVHQMALSMDSKAIGAIARSGASKIEDRRASEVILAAYGGYVCEAVSRTLDIVSASMGDGLEWTCDGFDNFQISSLDEELANVGVATSLGIPSPTFRRTIFKNVGTSSRVVGRIDEATKAAIEREIDEAIDAEVKSAEEQSDMLAAVAAVAAADPAQAVAAGQGTAGTPPAGNAQ